MFKDVEVIQVIKTTLTRRGNGSSIPIRAITEFWTLDGEKLAEIDPAFPPCDFCGRHGCQSDHK